MTTQMYKKLKDQNWKFKKRHNKKKIQPDKKIENDKNHFNESRKKNSQTNKEMKTYGSRVKALDTVTNAKDKTRQDRYWGILAGAFTL